MNKFRKKAVDITKPEEAMSSQKFIDKAFQEMDKCIKCGACCSVCPVFAEHGLEKYVARGKLALCEAAVDGTLPLTDEFRGVINNCILCMACVENCGNGVQVQQVIIGARALLVQKRGLPMLKQIIFRGMLASRLMMHSVLKTGSLMQWILFQRIPQSSGLRKRFPLPLIDEHRYVPKLARQPFLKQAHKFIEFPKGSQKVIFFVGCSTNYIYPNIARAVIKVLHRLGISVVIPEDQGCCGMPVMANGDLITARRLARENLARLLSVDDTSPVVVCCSSCGYMLKHGYMELLADDVLWFAKARTLGARTYDISEYLIKQIGPGKIAGIVSKTHPHEITYHDPCHLNRGQDITAEPRELLRIASGGKFTQMTEASRCCGSGGSYGITHRDTSRAVLTRKTDNIMSSQARTVATGCPGCIIQLLEGLQQLKGCVDVRHTIEVLADSI
jgi:glycolate oxidase iron-sulfur subunit